MTPAEDSLALSWMRGLSALGPELADGVLDSILAQLSTRELAALEHCWQFWQRPKQRLPEGRWRVLLVLAGRAFGKTRMLAEAVIDEIAAGRCRRLALISMTDEDARKVMVEGQKSGILARSPPWFYPEWQVSKEGGKLTWPNGAIGYVFSAESPRRIRGEEFDLAWWDEVANCSKEAIAALMYNLRLALRGNDHARLIMSTTPQRGVPMIRDLVKRALAKPGGSYRVIRGHTFDNAANLPVDYQRDLLEEYEGTTLGKQELEGEILDEDVEGAIFREKWIQRASDAPALVRAAVGVDPAISVRKGSDETGIVSAALAVDGKVYVFKDASGKHTANAWPRATVDLFDERRAGDRDVVVAERNRGGDLVAAALRGVRADLPIVEVVSQESKSARADRVAALYERGKVVHVGRDLVELEQQMLSWDPRKEKSPDRVDALVHAVFELAGDEAPADHFAGLDEANADLDLPDWIA